MNRKAIRDLASKELGLKLPLIDTPLLPPSYERSRSRALRGKTINEFVRKGQSTIKTEADIEKAWNYAVEGSRGDVVK
jgi:phosphoribosylglycinamide formyltransferase 2